MLKTAERGHDTAQEWVGTLYEGEGYIARDIEKAKKWFLMSAEQGNEGAKEGLERLKKLQEIATTGEDRLQEDWDASKQVEEAEWLEDWHASLAEQESTEGNQQ